MAQNEDWHKIVAKPLKKEKMTVAVAELLQWDPSLDAVMDMALGQGAEAFQLWTGKEMPVEAYKDAMRTAAAMPPSP